jgi:chlorite dismutase
VGFKVCSTIELMMSLPAVPLTIEGASVLHQMFRFRRAPWRNLGEALRHELAEEAAEYLSCAEAANSASYSLVGHKGDLMLVHFRRSFDELNEIELGISNLRLSEFLEPTSSYLSIVELGLYESTAKTYAALADRGIEPHTPEWDTEIEAVLDRQREAMSPRLWPRVPPSRYICFYPMDRKRGEIKNWYQVPMAERQRQMHEHGMVGRRYAGQVRQIISGSIGFDDWEWAVDLFADHPLAFKKLIYEMRFDEVSAVYALFGSFYVGLRFAGRDLPTFLSGALPPAAREETLEP